MKYSDHRLWRIYENVTAIIGWGALAALAWTIGDAALPQLMPDWPLVGEASHWLIGSIAWIFKADVIKYRITRDPRDHPFRKWWTFTNLKRYNFVMLRKGSTPSQNETLITTLCPSCDAPHGFEKNRSSLTYLQLQWVPSCYSSPSSLTQILVAKSANNTMRAARRLASAPRSAQSLPSASRSWIPRSEAPSRVNAQPRPAPIMAPPPLVPVPTIP